MKILVWFLLLAYITCILFIFIGGGYITNVLFNSEPAQLACVDITNETQLNIAKMTNVLFWIVFIPLSLLPFVLLAGYGKYL
jgi:hypothetical protein